MTDPTLEPREGAQHVAADRSSTAGMPRWVKVSLIVVGLLLALFIVLNIAGVGGRHGPGRHSGRSSTDLTPSSSVEHRPPAGVDHGP